MGYRGIGHMGPMGNGRTGGMWYRVWAMGYRGMQPMGNGGTGGMRHMGNEAHWGVWVQGYGAHGHRGYGVQGVWATWAKGYRGMGHMGNGAHARFAPKISKRCEVVKKMSSCQKDVKCQKMKHLDYGGGSQKN